MFDEDVSQECMICLTDNPKTRSIKIGGHCVMYTLFILNTNLQYTINLKINQ